jgi:DNA-binding transcriptional ArsR family regulator
MTRARLSPEAAERIARRHRALGDPTRLRILDLLLDAGESPVGEIAAAVGASQQNASKHLSVLRAEGLVVRRKQGTSSLHRVADRCAGGWLR